MLASVIVYGLSKNSFDLTQKRAKKPAGAPDRSLARMRTCVPARPGKCSRSSMARL